MRNQRPKSCGTLQQVRNNFKIIRVIIILNFCKWVSSLPLLLVLPLRLALATPRRQEHVWERLIFFFVPFRSVSVCARDRFGFPRSFSLQGCTCGRASSFAFFFRIFDVRSKIVRSFYACGTVLVYLSSVLISIHVLPFRLTVSSLPFHSVLSQE